MWKLRRSGSIESDLYDAADDLKQAVGQLLDISAQLIEGGNKQTSQLVAMMILSLQEDECMLRKHAASLRSESHGRRFDD